MATLLLQSTWKCINDKFEQKYVDNLNCSFLLTTSCKREIIEFLKMNAKYSLSGQHLSFLKSEYARNWLGRITTKRKHYRSNNFPPSQKMHLKIGELYDGAEYTVHVEGPMSNPNLYLLFNSSYTLYLNLSIGIFS